jgi:S-DNA-T family DNA segregation ATPase FtsK/SpoIIIE
VAFGDDDQLHTAELAERLGDGWNAARIADALRPYGITPADVKIGEPQRVPA